MKPPEDPAATLRGVEGTPPQDLFAEAACLSAALNSPGHRADLLGVLEPLHFYSRSNKYIWEAIAELSQSDVPVDMVTVRGWLKDRERLHEVGGAAYLIQICDATPALYNAMPHAEIVLQKWRQRAMIAVMQRYAAEGYGDIGDAEAWFERIERDVTNVAHRRDAKGLRPFRDVGQDALDYLSRASSAGGVAGAATGLVDLDGLMGGMKNGDAIVVAGRPGMGKTSFMLSIAAHVATPLTNGEPAPSPAAAIFSLEMPAPLLALRMLAAEARVDASRILKGYVRAEDWDKLASALAVLAKRPIYIDDAASISMREVRARAQRLARNLESGIAAVPAPRLGFVAIDYLQLLGGERAREQNREQFVAEQSKACKNLAKDLDLPVIALSQLNRSVEQRPNKRPQISDLRESGAIEQDADSILLLYCDDYYHKDSADAGVCEVIVGKNRMGPTGTVKVRFDRTCSRFDSIAYDYEFDDEEL